MNYKFGRKNQARRENWNKIKELALPNRKDQTVMYLAGTDDLDRPIACSKGFHPSNMIAVDIDKAVVKKLKSNGKIAICQSIDDAILTWPVMRGIDVIVADFCSGYTLQVIKFMTNLILSRSVNENTVVYVNMMRGREAKQDRECLNHTKKFAKYWYGLNTKHRGILFFIEYLQQVSIIDDCKDQGVDSPSKLIIKKPSAANLRECSEMCLPHFNKYKSTAGNIIMDSVVFKHAFGPKDMDTSVSLERSISLTYQNRKEEILASYRSNVATKASQTKRKTGVLPHSPHF